MTKVYVVDIKKNFISGEMDDDVYIGLFRKLKATNGEEMYLPKSHKIWYNEEEMFAHELSKWYKSGATVDAFVQKYKLSEDDGKRYFQFALEKFPEMFI